MVSAPSGAGKSTLVQRLVRSVPDLIFSISVTTRKPRPGEVEGRDYFFIDDERFDAMVREGGFVEWVQVYGRGLEGHHLDGDAHFPNQRANTRRHGYLFRKRTILV